MKYLLVAGLLCLGGCGFLMGAEKGLSGDSVPAVGTNGHPASDPSPLTVIGYGLGAAAAVVISTLSHGLVTSSTLKPLIGYLANSVPAGTHEVVHAAAIGTPDAAEPLLPGVRGA